MEIFLIVFFILLGFSLQLIAALLERLWYWSKQDD